MTFTGSTNGALCRGWLSLAFGGALLHFACGSSVWAEPLNYLNEDDRSLISQLGNGVVGAPIEPIKIETLIAKIKRSQVTEFLVVEGHDKGETIPVSIKTPHGITPSKGSKETPQWEFYIPDIVTQYFVEDSLGLRVPTLEFHEKQVVFTYQPPEPMLLSGVGPGDSTRIELDVQVHPLDHPETSKYSGHITATYTNKGSYQVKTPGGTFAGLVVRVDYQGKIGPATMGDSDLRIYSPEVGLLAISTHDRLKAILLLHTDERRTLLLAKPPSAGHQK